MSDNFVRVSPQINWKEQMEDEIESQVWRTAQQACSKVSFARLLEEAVASFKRIPGLDPIVRLHVSVIGAESIKVLRDALKRHHALAQLKVTSSLDLV